VARERDHRILTLALPALGAEAAQPLFVLCDTAIVGHLGSVQLGALSISGAVLNATVGLMIFLAYATTPAVARLLGAGDRAAAVRAGWTGIWLAGGLGLVLTACGEAAAGTVARMLGGTGPVSTAATGYLRISLLGLTPQLMALAATGLLRGLQNTRLPLAVAASGFSLNALLNWVLVYPVGLGLLGSAWGTVITQVGIALTYLWISLRLAHASDATIRPQRAALAGLARSGGWLMVRTASLQAGILLTVRLAAAAGPLVLAGYQGVSALFGVLQYALDALGVSGQALVGRARGAGDAPELRQLRRRLALWGVGTGTAALVLVVVGGRWLGALFTADPTLLGALPLALSLLACTLPLTGWVFAMDGVLLGAEDFRYLALAGLLNVALFLPVWGVLLWYLTTQHPPIWAALTLSWAAFGGWFSVARLLTLSLRLHSDRWMRLPPAVSGGRRPAAR
jgi:putative MATE family efflux protein